MKKVQRIAFQLQQFVYIKRSFQERALIMHRIY